MSSSPSSSGHEKHASTSQNDEPDEWDARLERGGCVQEHYKLQDCYLDTKDWRKCQNEMMAFKKCWAAKPKRDTKT